jgi:probable rRNA maturation factor
VAARRLVPGSRSLYVSPFRVDLTVRQSVPAEARAAPLARALAAALLAGGAPAPASVGLVLTDDRELAELNATHLGTAEPTDVLSFPLLPPEAYPPHEGGRPSPAAEAGHVAAGPAFRLPPGRRPHLGDVVVSVERAISQAEAGRGGQTGDLRWSPADELRLLVVHGGLHLCGWDHVEPAEEAAMRALEAELLGRLGSPARAGSRTGVGRARPQTSDVQREGP